MKKILSLIEEIELFMKRKSSICKCGPCICSEKTKDKYFQEFIEILTKFNKEYTRHVLTRISSFNQTIQTNSVINY